MSSRHTPFPILQVKNLPYNVKPEDLYELFGQFGNIHQIRLGTDAETRGQAFIIYKNYRNCQLAAEKLRGFNFNGRYLVVSVYTISQERVKEIREDMERTGTIKDETGEIAEDRSENKDK